MADIRAIADVAEIGPLLRQIRHGQEVTAADVAEAVDAHMTQVAAWERGERIPSLQSLIRVAYSLGYDVALVKR